MKIIKNKIFLLILCFTFAFVSGLFIGKIVQRNNEESLIREITEQEIELKELKESIATLKDVIRELELDVNCGGDYYYLEYKLDNSEDE